MNYRLSLRKRAPRRRRVAVAAPVEAPILTWIHDGVRHRVGVWPDVRFEREGAPGEWREAEPTEAAFASAALGVGAAQWRRYLEFVPGTERAFLERFEFSRLAALHVIIRCPEILGELINAPALTPFLALHRSLRGGDASNWNEITAIFEREGVFGVLTWLGLPASPQTLSILAHIKDPDLPRRLLEPLRSALWDPEAIWTLAHAPLLNDEQLAHACHALAA